MIAGVDVVLTCTTCGDSARVEAYFAKTRWGTLRLEGPSDGWGVDGSGAYCPQHLKPSMALGGPTWNQYDCTTMDCESDPERRR